MSPWVPEAAPALDPFEERAWGAISSGGRDGMVTEGDKWEMRVQWW